MTAITKSVDLDRRGRVAVLTVNNPPVNALSQHVRQGLHEGLKQAISDSGARAIVIVCAGRTFIAGADITEFGKPPAAPGLHEVLDMIESSSKPVIRKPDKTKNRSTPRTPKLAALTTRRWAKVWGVESPTK